MKEKIHYTDSWIINPTIPLTLFLIGAGGTGSNMLSCLAIINKSLIALGHPGLHVTVFDDDKVTEANIARQLFYTSDLGLHKASVLTQRINRAFGTNWDSKTCKYDRNVPEVYDDFTANITISCVDSVASRKEICKIISLPTQRSRNEDHMRTYYWLDCGNDVSSGQIYLGTLMPIQQPKSKFQTIDSLQDPWSYFRDEKDTKADGPSCSLAQAISKQDLFINRMIANYAGHMLWSLMKDARINYKGLYINLKTLQTNPIPL